MVLIRPWVRVLLARMQDPHGWAIDEYRMKLVCGGKPYHYLTIWIANGWFWSMRIDRWDNVDDPRGALYFNAMTIKQAFITKELFDPTTLCEYIMTKGIAKVVDTVFPLGDVDHFNPTFKELP